MSINCSATCNDSETGSRNMIEGQEARLTPFNSLVLEIVAFSNAFAVESTAAMIAVLDWTLLDVPARLYILTLTHCPASL